MKIKTRSKPLPLKKLDAIIPRLSHQFPKLPEIKQDVKKQASGYSGERKADYHLEALAPRYTILDAIYLPIFGRRFQIDSIVAANHSLFIVEVKNTQGTIIFDTILKQLIRSDGVNESGFDYPITQVENQKFHLQNWLQYHDLAHIPIYYFIAIADPATIIEVKGDREEIAEFVAHAARIPKMIMDKDEELAQSGFRKLHDYQIGSTILRECREFDIDIMKQYGITQADILPGVICPECGMRGMERLHSTWICKKCQQKNRNAHWKELDDYVLLNGFITNKECMRVLGLTSRSVATRILQKSELVYSKGRNCWINKR